LGRGVNKENENEIENVFSKRGRVMREDFICGRG
jgi:hypothetical protein